MAMDTFSIVLLTVAIALLAGALAWYGPRRRHWRTHPHEGRKPDTGDGSS